MSFDNQGKPSRGLPYPLKNPETFSIVDAEGSVTHLTPDIFPPDNDEKINIVLNLSLNEFVAIASSIDVGSDIAYGDDRNLIWWTWVRSFIGTAATMTCEDVADCIEGEIAEGNTTLINSLTQNNIANGTGGNYNRVNGDITTVLDRNSPLSLQEEINPEFECNLDALWGGIRHGIVERLDDTARDLLEDLAVINDIPQRFQAFIDVIPVLGDIAEGIVTLATEVIPDILNLYNSYSSEAILDEIACDLFAMVCDECRYPTFEELYNYYSTLGYELSAMNAQTLAPLMQKIAGMIGALQPSSVVYHSMITFQLFTLYLQAEWNGNAGVGAILKFAKIGEDFASNNWFDLCDSCDNPYRIKIWDLTQSENTTYRAASYPTTSGHGIYVAGTGWIPQQLGAEGNGFISVGIPLKPEWRIRAIGLKFANQASGNGNLTYNIFRVTPSQNAGGLPPAIDWGTTGWTYYENGFASITGFKEYGISYSTQLNLNRALTHIGIIFDAEYAPPDATPTDVNTFSATVFP